MLWQHDKYSIAMYKYIELVLWVRTKEVEAELHVREVKFVKQREAQHTRVEVQGDLGVFDAKHGLQIYTHTHTHTNTHRLSSFQPIYADLQSALC